MSNRIGKMSGVSLGVLLAAACSGDASESTTAPHPCQVVQRQFEEAFKELVFRDPGVWDRSSEESLAAGRRLVAGKVAEGCMSNTEGVPLIWSDLSDSFQPTPEGLQVSIGGGYGTPSHQFNSQVVVRGSGELESKCSRFAVKVNELFPAVPAVPAGVSVEQLEDHLVLLEKFGTVGAATLCVGDGFTCRPMDAPQPNYYTIACSPNEKEEERREDYVVPPEINGGGSTSG